MSLLKTYSNKRLLNETAEGDPGAGGEPSSDDAIQAFQSQLADKDKEIEAMRAKMDQLLGETKKAKQLKREEEARARQLAEEKARKEGDFEQLHRSSEQERQKLQQQLADLHSSIAKEKETAAAQRIASQLADGANAELLSEFIARRLKYTDDGIKVTDTNGDLTVSSLDQLKEEFSNNDRFSSLLRGSQATGGSASGGRASSPTDKVMTRAEFDGIQANKRQEFLKSGGKVID